MLSRLVEPELTYGDLEVIKCSNDCVENCAATMLYERLSRGRATKQALVSTMNFKRAEQSS